MATRKKTTTRPAAPAAKTGAAKPAATKAPASATVKPAPKAKAVKPRAAAKPVAPKPAKPADKPAKEKKPKLVRDSFTIPKAEYVVLDALKARAGKLARPVKKSELLRAGIKALATMADADYLKALGAVPAIKTGRPTAGA
jgi:hypothetical protein